MSHTCYFCNGLVAELDSDHILLANHADHEIYMHERCAAGHNVVEPAGDAGEGTAVTCPECGVVETRSQLGPEG